MGFKDHLNSVEPSIQFTVELETNHELSFLDTLIHHHENGTITTKAYRKQSHTNQYQHFDSRHPMAHKQAVIKTLFNRAKGVCSNALDRMKKELYITNALKDNGYPLTVVKKYNNNSPSKQSDRDPRDATVVRTYPNLLEEFSLPFAQLGLHTLGSPFPWWLRTWFLG